MALSFTFENSRENKNWNILGYFVFILCVIPLGIELVKYWQSGNKTIAVLLIILLVFAVLFIGVLSYFNYIHPEKVGREEIYVIGTESELRYKKGFFSKENRIDYKSVNFITITPAMIAFRFHNKGEFIWDFVPYGSKQKSQEFKDYLAQVNEKLKTERVNA